MIFLFLFFVLYHLIFREKHEKNLPICALKWNPKGNHELAYCDTEGQLGVMENVVSAHQEEEVRKESFYHAKICKISPGIYGIFL